MRQIGGALFGTGDVSQFYAAIRYAEGIECSCSLSFAFRLDAARLRWSGQPEAAVKRLADAKTAADDRCRYCTADHDWRLGSLREDHSLLWSSLRIFTELTLSEVRRRNHLQAAILRTASTAPLWRLARAGETENPAASLRVYAAIDHTTSPRDTVVRGRKQFKARNYRWWDRSAPCPSLPTARVRDAYNVTAIERRAFVLANQGTSDAREEARALYSAVLRRTGLNAYLKAIAHWSLAELKADLWQGNRHKRDIQSSVDRHMVQALRSLIAADCRPSDMVACLIDAVRMPWNANRAGLVLSAIFDEISEVSGDSFIEIMTALAEQDAELLREWQSLQELAFKPKANVNLTAMRFRIAARPSMLKAA